MRSHWMFVITAVTSIGCGVGSIPSDQISDEPPVDGGEVQNTVVFRPTIQSDLSSAGCLSAPCHGGGAVPMQLVTAPSTDEEWLANFQEVQARTGALIGKSTGAGGHTASMTAGDPILQRWELWIGAGAPYEQTSASPDAGVPADAGEFSDAASGPVTWNTTIRQIVIDDGCTVCHGLQGAYSLETYSNALGFGTDQTIPNVIPGDPASLLITYYEDEEHHPSQASHIELVRRWIVDDNAAE